MRYSLETKRRWPRRRTVALMRHIAREEGLTPSRVRAGLVSCRRIT